MNPLRHWPLAACTLLALASGVAGYLHTTPGTPVAVHFGPGGLPNGWASPAIAFFALPAFCVALLLIQMLLPGLKPSADHLEKTLVKWIFRGIGIVLVVAQAYLVARAVQ